ALYGVLASCKEPTVLPLFEPPAETAAYHKFAAEMAVREKKLHDFVDRKHTELVTSARTRAAEYLLAAHDIRRKPRTEDFMLLTDKGELHPVMIERWRAYLEHTRLEGRGAWTIWHALADLPEKDFAAKAAEIVGRIVNPSAKTVGGERGRALNPLVREAFAKDSPKSLAETAKRYGELLARVDQVWQKALKQSAAEKQPPPQALPNPAEEELRDALYGPDAAARIAKVFDYGFLTLLPDRP